MKSLIISKDWRVISFRMSTASTKAKSMSEILVNTGSFIYKSNLLFRELQERLALSTEDFNSQLLRNLNQRDKMK
jgi:ADP-glucose pyrophosphorylase